MGVFQAGPFSTVKNKIGGIVCSTWKGINTAREYKIPSNPQTVAQTAQRDRFSAIQSYASQLLATIITTFWNPFAVKMSGYNYFIQQNINELADTTFYLSTTNLLSKGTLESITTPAGVLAAGSVSVTWEQNVLGNGALTDSVQLVVVNKETFATYLSSAALTRDDEAGTVVCTGETDATKLILFAIAYRGTGSSYIVSTSTSAQVTA